MAAIHAHVDYRPHLGLAYAGTKLHDALATAFATVRTWYLRASARRELRARDDRLLADVGITRAEVSKPFWQA